METQPPYMTPDQAAELLGMTRCALAVARCKGKGGPPFLRLPNGRIRYKRSDVVEWAEGAGTFKSVDEAREALAAGR